MRTRRIINLTKIKQSSRYPNQAGDISVEIIAIASGVVAGGMFAGGNLRSKS